MRGVVLAIVLAPASIDDSVVHVRSHWVPVLARSDLGEQLRQRLLRPPASFGAKPIPLWTGPVPWKFIPPFPPPLKPEPARNSVPGGLAARSLGIIPARLELPVSGSPAP